MELAEKILSSLFPSRCILCLKTVDHNGRSSQPGSQSDSQSNQLTSSPPRLSSRVEICAACEAALPLNTCYCQRCALPLPDDLAGGDQAIICGRCIKKPPAFDYAYSLFRYEAQSIKLVHQLKFGGKISYARSIGEMLLAALQQNMWQQPREKPTVDRIVCCPCHYTNLVCDNVGLINR